jgi:hypothetical protein
MVVSQRLKGVYENMEELSSLTGQNMDVIEHMMRKVKSDKEVFERSLMRFQATRSIFSQQTNVLYTRLNIRALDALIAQTKKDMEIGLTTAGLKGAMENFFKQVLANMDQVATQANEIKDMMEGVYRKFQEEYGLTNVRPGGYSVLRYIREIKRLQAKHDQFMSGLTLMITEQKALTRKFFESTVAKIRAIYKMANRDADNWLKNIMAPMETQVREHQIQLRRRLESIKRIHQASDTLEDRIKELEQIRDGIRAQAQGLDTHVDGIMQLLHPQQPAEDSILGLAAS